MSLTEVLVFALLLTLVLAAVYSLLTSGIGSWGKGETAIELQQNARLAMNKMVEEIRKAHTIVNAENVRGTSYDFPTNGSEISFVNEDSDKDGDYDVYDKIIKYRIGGSSGATLVNWVFNPPPKTKPGYFALAEYVEELNFRFFDANSVEILPTNDISLTNYYDNVTCIEISIVVSKDKMRKQLTSKVRLRNR
ncbi:MAG: hypothetical protein QMD08_02515 [Actinomycetota bacterium]|nr:hypothetical protein [Actinomycetota bacterium]